MKNNALNDHGNIPARTDCPFRSRCEIAQSGSCMQKGTSQGASVMTLINDPTMQDLVGKLPSAQRAVKLIDAVIAEITSADMKPIDGFLELSYNLTFERAQAEGLYAAEIQFVLNSIDRDATSIGGRDSQNNWLDKQAALAILRGASLKDPASVRAARSTTAVIRIAAFHGTDFSCAAAHGFALTEA